MDLDKFLSQQECEELTAGLNTKYRLALKARTFEVKAVRDEGKVLVKVLLRSDDDSFYYPVEARILFQPEEMQPYDAALFLVDYIDSYFEEFLLEEDEDLYLPIDWADHEYEAVNFQIRGQIQNKKLDDMANEMLRKDTVLVD